MLLLNCAPAPSVPPDQGDGGVVSLHAENLRPTVGEEQSLYATWAGPWPAEVRWEVGQHGAWTPLDAGRPGVFEGHAEGTRATLRLLALGDYDLRANGAMLRLHARDSAIPMMEPVPMKLEPLPEVQSHCRDDRFPALAGLWVVWCSGPEGVDRAMHLLDRKVVELRAAQNPGTGPGILYAPGVGQGLWRLPETAPAAGIPLVAQSGIAPPASDGVYTVVPYADNVQLGQMTAKTRTNLPASPLPQQSVGLADGQAAWVQNGGATGEDIWWSNGVKPEPWARNPEPEWGVTGNGHWLAWVEPERVIIEDLRRKERRPYAAQSGFLHGPSLWQGVACWEDRSASTDEKTLVDLRCSDGMTVERPEEQSAPWRWGPYLLWHEQRRVMLATATSLVLGEEDPRREDGVWKLDWPVEGWTWERWEDGWKPMGPVPRGEVALGGPEMQRIRLVAP